MPGEIGTPENFSEASKMCLMTKQLAYKTITTNLLSHVLFLEVESDTKIKRSGTEMFNLVTTLFLIILLQKQVERLEPEYIKVVWFN